MQLHYKPASLNYKAAVLRLHQDTPKDDAEEFKLLQSNTAWVDALTEAEFAASQK
jgi:hypothetical protein